MMGWYEKNSSEAWGKRGIDRQERGNVKDGGYGTENRNCEVSWCVLLQQGKGLTKARKGCVAMKQGSSHLDRSSLLCFDN